MASLCLYLQDSLDNDGICRRSPALLGAILLDAIFPPIQRYLEVIRGTDEQYSSKSTFDDIAYIIDILGLKSPQFHPIQKLNCLGNPSKDLKSFRNVTKLTIDNISPPSQHRAAIKRNKALHAYLKNIKLLLEIAQMSFGTDGDSSKALFLFHILNDSFHIADAHILHTPKQYPLFVSLYKDFLEILTDDERSENFENGSGRKRNFQISFWSNTITEKKDIISTIDLYSQRTLHYLSNDLAGMDHFSSLWDEISQWDYIREFLNSVPIDKVFERLLDLFNTFAMEADSKNEYAGNLEYINDISSFMMEKMQIDIDKANCLRDKMKMVKEELDSQVKRKEFWTLSDYAMPNPFYSCELKYELPQRLDFNFPCPLFLYKLPVKRLSTIRENIRRDLKQMKSTSDCKDDPDQEKCIESLVDLVEPLINFEEYYHLIEKEKIDIDSFQYLEGLLDDERETYKKVVSEREQSHNKPIQFVKALTIEEWKAFFLRFCRINKNIIADSLVGETCTALYSRFCYGNFLKRLREIYIKNLKYLM